MGITVGDVLYTRDGKPVLVTSKDAKTGNLTVERDYDRIRQATNLGLKNGLPERAKDAYRAVLSSVEDEDKRAAIDDLVKQVDELRKENADPRLLRYLESELQHRIQRDHYHPKEEVVDPATLIT